MNLPRNRTVNGCTVVYTVSVSVGSWNSAVCTQSQGTAAFSTQRSFKKYNTDTCIKCTCMYMSHVSMNRKKMFFPSIQSARPRTLVLPQQFTYPSFNKHNPLSRVGPGCNASNDFHGLRCCMGPVPCRSQGNVLFLNCSNRSVSPASLLNSIIGYSFAFQTATSARI